MKKSQNILNKPIWPYRICRETIDEQHAMESEYQQKDKTYILVLNWNNWRDTIECLESVFQNSYPNYQVVCIDNGSTDDSEQKIKEWAEGKRVVTSNYFTFNANNKPIPCITYDRKTAEEGGF